VDDFQNLVVSTLSQRYVSGKIFKKFKSAVINVKSLADGQLNAG